MDKLYYSWNDLEIDCRNITREMAIDGYRPDVVIGPGRGGYPVGVMFSHYFDVPFISFKYISDGADINANDDWEENVAKGIEVFQSKVLEELQ